MQIILKKDIPNLGRIGEVVKVRSGFARNYLIPRALAVVAVEGKQSELEHSKRLVEIHKKKVRVESEASADQLKNTVIEIEVRVNESNKLFGSLTNAEVAAELEKKGIKFDRRDVQMEPVKTTGEHKFQVRLPGDVFVEMTLQVKGIVDKSAVKASAKKTRSKKADKPEETANAEEAQTPAEAVTESESSE